LDRLNKIIIRGSGIAAIATLLSLSPTVARTSPSCQPDCILLAQEEGDYDQSFDAYGQDIDEVLENDEAVIKPDSAKAHIDSLMQGIKWLGHASFLIEDGVRIYIDPFRLPDGLQKADIVLITHDHSDHFSPDDLAKILKPSTVVVSTAQVVGSLPKTVKHTTAMAPGDTVTVEGVRIEAVPAYNIGKDYHPKNKGYLGFIVTYGGRRIYHAGDTDLIPEMKTIKADVALLPAGGKYTMDAKEAARAANLIKPGVAVPMHWGTIVGTEKDALAFKAMCNVPVVIMGVEPAPEKKKGE
jgi:L-ascorbate metabolism protein UlaG (beta-lactamase superfamily)